MVRQKRPRPAVAADARPVRRLGVGDHAAADTGQDGDPVLGTMDEPPAGCRYAGQRPGGHGHQVVGGARLLFAGAKHAEGRTADPRRARRPFSARPDRGVVIARGGALHRRRGLQHRVQPIGTDRRRERHSRAHARGRHRRVAQGEAGARTNLGLRR